MGLNILVVDDSLTVRAVIAKTLELGEIQVDELLQAENGKEALEILDNNWVDLVFTDINMPVMNGIEMIDQMEKDGLLNTIPVVIISTEGSQTRIEQMQAKGVKAYIRKPFTPEQLSKVVNDLVGGQK
jgi:two-component system, chemotaxis family, chemotaxis protein CheY